MTGWDYTSKKCIEGKYERRIKGMEEEKVRRAFDYNTCLTPVRERGRKVVSTGRFQTAVQS